MKRTLLLAVAVATLALGAGVATGRGISCPGGPCTGTPNDDVLVGSELEDQISALGGEDSLFGNGGDDVMKGGPGEDFLSEEGAQSSDRLIGGPDDDYLEGGRLGDVLRGGPGDEQANLFIRGPKPPDFRIVSMYGDQGNDRLSGGSGRDSMEGEEGRDVMKGGSGNDYLDAVNDDTDGTRDVVDCGKGFDRYSARAGDKVDDSCEKKIPPGPKI